MLHCGYETPGAERCSKLERASQARDTNKPEVARRRATHPMQPCQRTPSATGATLADGGRAAQRHPLLTSKGECCQR